MKVSDFRSDTVTVPTEAMRRAMAEAEVGDDVYRDDPTVLKIESTAAEIFGKEAALFVPTGTMANQMAIRLLTRPGDEVICDEAAHIFLYEAGAPALLSNVQLRPIEGLAGRVDLERVRNSIRSEDVHHPRTSLVAVENTHNIAGGRVLPLDDLWALRDLCRERDIAIHMDGARIFNAQAATGTPVREWARACDTVSCCLSKGLGAPIGSLLLGDRDLMERALKVRKSLGGGMRQAGVLAAPGMIALTEMPDRLVDDHRRAKRLAEELNRLPLFEVDVDAVETNIIFVGVPEQRGSVIGEAFADQGVKLSVFAPNRLRLVTHHQLGDDDVDHVLAVARQICDDASP